MCIPVRCSCEAGVTSVAEDRKNLDLEPINVLKIYLHIF